MLGLTGMPLPSEIEDKVRLVAESRAVRPWEFLDEGIVPFWGQANSPAVAAEFSYVRIAPRQVASKKGDLVVVTRIIINSTVAAQILVNSAGIPDAISSGLPRDLRFSNLSFLGGFDLEVGAEAATSGTQFGVLPVTLLTLETFFVLPVSLSLVVPSFPSLAVWSTVVNTAIRATFEGLYIPATR